MESERPANDPALALAVSRHAMMATLAGADATELAEGLAITGLALEDAAIVRAPEIGLVMVRGRQGGTGKPFNLGEATVTRATVQTPDGTLGVSCVLGRKPEKARLAAIIDAFWQNSRHREAIETTVLLPIRERLAADRNRKREETAATTVDFFTMVRGDD